MFVPTYRGKRADVACARRLPATVGVMAVLVLSHAALAADLNPPGSRGQPLSAQFAWNDLPVPASEQFTLSADTVSAVDDEDPSTYLNDAAVPAQLQLEPTDPGAATYTIDLPGFVSADRSLSLLRAQLTWVGDSVPSIDVIYGTKGWEYVEGSPLVSSEPTDNYQWQDWQITPNTDFSTIMISVQDGTALTSLVVDTVILPEPGTAALLALGVPALLKRRR